MNEWKEAAMTINGIPLTVAEVMMIRVAISGSSFDCGSDDEHGRVMTQAYNHHKARVLRLMMGSVADGEAK